MNCICLCSMIQHISRLTHPRRVERVCWRRVTEGDLQVSEYVRERILALRDQHSPQYNNIACLRTNAQKHLINYFRKGQLTKLFFLFPVRIPSPDGANDGISAGCYFLPEER